jgi:hypothetical protein
MSCALRFLVGSFGAAIVTGAHAFTVSIDGSPDRCALAPGLDALRITCPADAHPAIRGAVLAASFEKASLDGKDAMRIVIPHGAEARVDVSATSSGWNVMMAAVPSSSSLPASPSSQAKRDAAIASTPAPAAPSPRLTPIVPGGGAKADKADAPVPTPSRADQLASTLKDIQLDYSVPQMPAFTVIGMTPEGVTQPRTARALAAAIQNGLDENGKPKTGIAMEFQPFRLKDPAAVLRTYLPDGPGFQPHRFNTIEQALYSSSISIATAKGTSADDPSMRLGIGLKIPIFDLSDGRTDQGLIACYDKVVDNWLKAASEADEEKVAKDSTRCYNNRTSARWNASAWTVSLGGAWTSDSGNFNDRKTSTHGIWTTYAYGFEGMDMLSGSAQLILHLRAINDERVADPTTTGQFVNQDSRVAGLGFKLGSESLNGTVQWSYQRLKLENQSSTDKVRRLSIGLDWKVAPDLWLVATVGGEGGRQNGESKSFVLAGLRYGLSPTPQFAPGK